MEQNEDIRNRLLKENIVNQSLTESKRQCNGVETIFQQMVLEYLNTYAEKLFFNTLRFIPFTNISRSDHRPK